MRWFAELYDTELSVRSGVDFPCTLEGSLAELVSVIQFCAYVRTLKVPSPNRGTGYSDVQLTSLFEKYSCG